LSFLDHT